MKKFIIIGIIFVFIVLIAIIGSILVTPRDSIEKKEDVLVIQSNLEKDYNCYGYTIDNPKIVVNPFKIAPLSALIMFETEGKGKVGVYLVDKNNNKYLLYEDEESKEHYLDIYNLYANYDNKVILLYNGIEYEYVITTKLDEINKEDTLVENGYVRFLNSNNDIYGVNYENEIVYYFKGYNKNALQLSNGHLLLTNGRVNNDNYSVGFSEVDMLGRIYNDYVISNGYKNIISVLDNGNYLVLSDDIIEIDRQNGKVIKKFDIDNDLDVLNISVDNDLLVVDCKEKRLYFDYDKLKIVKEDDFDNSIVNDNVLKIKFSTYYNKYVQNRFGNIVQTKIDKTDINLLFNKKKDNLYKDCDLEFNQDFDMINVSKKCDDNVMLILDKFMDRRFYKINGNVLHVSNTGLHGEYIIYIKINNNVYKTGYYVKIV